MVESGDWLVPRYQGQPFFDKPVLTYWLMAAAMRAFGETPAAARLVPVLAALALVAATAWLGLLLFDRRSALSGALVLATSVAFLSFARVAMSDLLLAVFTTVAVALAVRAFQGEPPWWLPASLGASLGLGFATKGPIALLVPGVAILLLLLRRREGAGTAALASAVPLGAGGLVSAAVAFAVLGLGWFALIYGRLGSEPLVYFFLRENLERFAGEAYDVGRPFWFYPPAYLAEGLPWSLFLPLALWRLLRGAPDERRAAGFLASWAALVLVPLSLSRGKIDYYLLPIYPGLSLVIGRYFASVPWRRLDRGWARAVLVFAAVAVALPDAWLPAAAAGPALVVVASLVAALLLAVALRPSPLRVAATLAATTAAAFLLVAALFLPAFAARQPNRAIAADVARERAFVPQARLVVCDDPSHARRDVLFMARHTGIEQCDLWSLAASRQPYLFLVTPAQDASLRVLPGYRHVATYAYLPARTLTLGGLLDGADPEQLVLLANFATPDPVAERKKKREYRQGIQRELVQQALEALRGASVVKEREISSRSR